MNYLHFRLAGILLFVFLSLGLAQEQDRYLDETSWLFLTTTNQLFEQAFSDASRGVNALSAQQYVLSLSQLFQAMTALELDLREQQGSPTPTLELSYLLTAIASLSSGISSLIDYYQQLQSPMTNPGILQNTLRIAQLNSTIYWLALSLYLEKQAQ